MEDTEKEIAKRRIQLFNLKVRALPKDMFTRDAKREKELETERQKLSTVLAKKYNITNVDELLLKVN